MKHGITINPSIALESIGGYIGQPEPIGIREAILPKANNANEITKLVETIDAAIVAMRKTDKTAPAVLASLERARGHLEDAEQSAYDFRTQWGWKHTNVTTWKFTLDVVTYFINESDTNEWDAGFYSRADSDSGPRHIGRWNSRVAAMNACARQAGQPEARHTWEIRDWAVNA